MIQKMRVLGLLILAGCTLSGCVSIEDANSAFRRVDRVWQLDYQKTEEELRQRVVDSDIATTYNAVRLTFIDLNLPVRNGSIESREIVGENEAPAPLTKEEWLEVVKIENPRMREIEPWWMYLPDNPNKYIVTVKATLRPVQDKTFVLMEYTLDAPELRRRGVVANQYGPPTAVKMAMEKFWRTLTSRLSAINIKEPRRRSPEEEGF